MWTGGKTATTCKISGALKEVALNHLPANADFVKAKCGVSTIEHIKEVLRVQVGD